MKDIDISSTNRVDALKLSTTAEVDNLVKQSKIKYMFGIGVQVSDVKNNADAIVKGSVNIKSSAENRVPDAAVDGFRMAWQLIDSSKRYGVKVRNQFTGETYERA